MQTKQKKKIVKLKEWGFRLWVARKVKVIFLFSSWIWIFYMGFLLK
jgi:hypothetical protein